MPIKKTTSVLDQLSHTSISSKENRIEKLSVEIEKLKAENEAEKALLEKQINQLRQELIQQSGEHEVPLEKIIPNPDQPRKTFTEQDIVELAHSIERYGQIEPIILIPQGNGINLIFDGERRFRAARLRQSLTIRSVFMPQTKYLHRKALITTLHRQDLNALDRAEAVLKEIHEEVGLEPKDSAQLIKSCIFRLDNQRITRKLTSNIGRKKEEYDFSGLELNELEEKVISVLLDLSLNPSSFLTFDLKAISLPLDLQNAIRTQGLPIKHAFLLNRLSVKNLRLAGDVVEDIRKKATAHVLKNKLSEVNTRNYVKSLIYSELPQESSGTSKTKLVLKSSQKIINTIDKLEFTIGELEAIKKEMSLIIENINQKMEKLKKV